MKMQKLRNLGVYLGAATLVLGIGASAQAAIYNVTGTYLVTISSPAAAEGSTGTFSFEVSGNYDSSVASTLTVLTGDTTAPLDITAGDTINTGPLGSNFIFNDPAGNFNAKFSTPFDGTTETGGTGTSTDTALAGGAFQLATISNLTVSVPEPGSLSVLAAGGLALLRRRRRCL